MKSADVAVMRLQSMLNPINDSRFPKQCISCKFCHDITDDFICILGQDINSLDPCLDSRDYGILENENGK